MQVFAAEIQGSLLFTSTDLPEFLPHQSLGLEGRAPSKTDFQDGPFPPFFEKVLVIRACDDLKDPKSSACGTLRTIGLVVLSSCRLSASWSHPACSAATST